MPPAAENSGEGSGRFVTLREIMITIAGLVLVVLTLVLGRASAMVVLITAKNETLPFPDLEASFAPRVPASGLSGLFYEAFPLKACDPILNGPGPLASSIPVFAIVERGDCKFDEKVLNAQDAGFTAVIIFNNEDGHDLVSMSGSSDDVRIPAVFVSKSAGETLLGYSKEIGARCFILPAMENTAWSVMAVSFISLLAVTAVLTTFLFVRRYRLRHLGSRLLLLRDSLGMSSREVKALPTILFKCGQASETCAICLEDYESGEKLRVLPCNHDFHVPCVDQWLTTRRPFCPVCKRDAHSKSPEPPPSESTPLLAAAAASVVAVPVVAAIQAGTQTSPVGTMCEGDWNGLRRADSEEDEEDEEESSSAQRVSGGAFGFHSAPDTFLQIDDSSSNIQTRRLLSGGESGEDLC